MISQEPFLICCLEQLVWEQMSRGGACYHAWALWVGFGDVLNFKVINILFLQLCIIPSSAWVSQKNNSKCVIYSCIIFLHDAALNMNLLLLFVAKVLQCSLQFVLRLLHLCIVWVSFYVIFVIAVNELVQKFKERTGQKKSKMLPDSQVSIQSWTQLTET